MNGNNVTQTPALPPNMHTELKEYSRRRGTEYPYNDDLDVDVLIVGAGFGTYLVPSALRLSSPCAGVR